MVKQYWQTTGEYTADGRSTFIEVTLAPPMCEHIEVDFDQYGQMTGAKFIPSKREEG